MATGYVQQIEDGVDLTSAYVRETYIVANAATGIAARAATNIPAIGDEYGLGDGRFCSSVVATNLGKGSWDWTVVATYRPTVQVAADPSRPAIDGSSLVVKAWRTDAALPDNLNVPPSTEADDIGGTPIDEAGQPVDVVSYSLRRSFTYLVDAPADEASYTSSLLTRNDDTFGPYAAGHVLFTDFAVEPQSVEKDRVTVNFVVDPFAHLRQRTFYTSEGDPKTVETSPEVDASLWGRAKSVVWYQPFAATSDFTPLVPPESGGPAFA